VDVVTTPFQEKVAVFGEGRSLVGVLTIPTGAQPSGPPHVILLSTGILHRVGSNRLWVTLARALGTAGIASLRFDLSGIGDSERRGNVASIRESVERDIAEAIDYLHATQGADRFVLVGLCSGAYDACHAALGEPRVVGAAMVDMPGPFRTWRHTAHHLIARVFRLASWRDPVRKALYYSREILRTGLPGRARDNDGYVVGARSSLTRERLELELNRLLDRGVRLFIAFTSGLEGNYNHWSQFRHVFPAAARHPALSFAYFPDADHLFSAATSRAQFLNLLLAWIQQLSPSPIGRSDG
jgi:alpha-beta hydrolase superfamily lysophospholipase